MSQWVESGRRFESDLRALQQPPFDLNSPVASDPFQTVANKACYISARSGTAVMTVRTAQCHCGDLVLRCDGEPRKISMCHCLDCQRRTGSAFSVAVFYDRQKVHITGSADFFQRISASGFPVDFKFCPRCGSNVFWEPARMPSLIGVGLGAFGSPDFPQPQQSVWTRDKHRWLALPPEMAAYDLNPPPRSAT